MLSAPAGYGKTTLLAQWASTLSSDEWHIAWLSLDERDNDPSLFWNYVLTALDACVPGTSEAALTLLAKQSRFSWEPVLTTLINSVSHQDKRVLLILDDYHYIHESSLYAAFIFLLEHLPSQLRLVLSTRTDPPFPLAQLRAQGQLHEVRAEQLRCTTEETAHFLTQVMQLPLSQVEIQHFAHRTEGWLVGLKLAALSLHQQAVPAHFLASLQGNQRYILDYLTNDVLFSLTPQLQHFLLATSILEEMCSSLCDAVVGDTGSQDLLEEIERSNLFVSALDAQREWYRYHQLFAEALRYRLQRTHKEQFIHDLHMRACLWYQEYEHSEQAIHHALEAQEWDIAAELIESSSFPGAQSSYRLVQWLQRLPEDTLRAHPSLCVAYARSLYYTDQRQALYWLQQAEQFLRIALEADEQEGQALTHSQVRVEQRNILGEVFGLQVTIKYLQQDWRMTLAACEEASLLLKPENVKGHATILQVQAQIYAMKGDFIQAITVGLEAAALSHTINDAPSEIFSLGTVAYCCSYTGHLHQAQQIIEQALLLTERQAQSAETIYYYIYGLQGYLYWHRGCLEQAYEWLTRAYDIAHKAKLIAYLDMLCAHLARVCLSQGEVQQAEAFLHQARQTAYERRAEEGLRDIHYLLFTTGAYAQLFIAQKKSEHVTITHQVDKTTHGTVWCLEEMAICRLLLAQSRTGEALVRLTPLLAEQRKLGNGGIVIEVLLLIALAYQQNQQEDQALPIIAEAIELAAPEEMLQVFFEEGAPIEHLLYALQWHWQKQGRNSLSFLDHLLAVFPSEQHEGKPDISYAPEEKLNAYQGLVEPLSKREAEVLELLVLGLTNRDIAERLTITVSTVKQHVSSILGKLGVVNRSQAQARIRMLGLL
ncbi:LuxR family transcriptional regulator [Dictyobacter formicarum]|uniref:LuxR family transcriptional regulator n=1 Tax=Dictyobacter formicarum TaxID=2778368 RepID=A0ABQ3V8T3_9CHLR|nr:LuxR family transcriptional regulator [Dictyobacter formicarum]